MISNVAIVLFATAMIGLLIVVSVFIILIHSEMKNLNEFMHHPFRPETGHHHG